MPRLLIALMILVFLTLSGFRAGVEAQTGTQPQQGDPPVASLITISPADDSGLVTVSGAAGAVFPAAQVAVRNLYTGQTVYTHAGVTGTFTTSIYGPGNTPFWISPAQNIPAAAKNRPGSLPGGPGTIVYGPLSETRTPPAPVTQIMLDGDVSDWQAYPQAALATVSDHAIYAFRNTESLYIAIAGDQLPTGDQRLELNFTFDATSYTLTLNPNSSPTLGSLKQSAPDTRDRGFIPVAVAVGSGAIELRIVLDDIRNLPITVSGLNSIRFVNRSADGSGGGELMVFSVEQSIPPVNEEDGVFYPHGQLGEDFTRFTISGVVANGASTWTARGRVKSLALAAGNSLNMELDVTMDAPDVPAEANDLRMIGQISLEPVIDGSGQQAAGGQEADNGWSKVLTPGGLPIDGLRSDYVLGQTSAEPPQIIRRDGQLIFGLSFTLLVPTDFPAGIYVPVFHGWGQSGSGQPFRWEDNSVLGQGDGTAQQPLARLPLTLNLTNASVSSVTGGHLIWTLFEDSPSDGSRGLLANEDRTLAGLSNRTRFNSPTYILPRFVDGTDQPAIYPIEPYLLNEMPNAYGTASAPLVPFLFPGGRLNVQVKRPDGTTDNLGSAPILQTALSTSELDERQRFGANSPVDVYRLTTLNPLFSEYKFDQYGQYQITLTGSLEDVWGNRYDGGGTYSLLVADLLDMTPGVLPGTPFEVGNWLNPGLTVAPGVPAEVTITVHVYPLDGGEAAGNNSAMEKTIQGTADARGYFHPAVASADSFQFAAPGEYVIDYEARYTDADGHLWAGSQRSAGVIGSPNSPLEAHGSRGLLGQSADQRQAWFDLNQYAAASGVSDSAATVNYPYQSGDVATIPDSADSGINAIIRLQDTQRSYRDWLTAMLPTYIAPDGSSIYRAAIEGELPAGTYALSASPNTPYPPSLVGVDLSNAAYTYVSAVRPGVTERQFVLGADDPSLPTAWDPDDPDNGQLGAGVTGDRPGDFIFLFGGAVVRLTEANIQEVAIYGSLAVVLDPRNDKLGARVYPPFEGEAGGADGGPLLTVAGQPVEMFFHLTGVHPGQVLTLGDTLAVAGQVAPTLASNVDVTITAPGGAVHQFSGTANAIGYFYDPANDFAVEEAGVWTVQIGVSHSGWTSAGQIEPPEPTGGVLGVTNGTFQVYVLPENTTPIVSNLRRDFTFPASPYNFNFDLPKGWTNVQAYYSLTIPGYILGQGQPRISGRSFSYQYNPTILNQTFPNYEDQGRADGPAVSDVATLTFVVTGTDAEGNSRITSRTFTIMHDRLISLE